MTALREIRQKAGMSQVELAKILGNTPEAICLWESGARKPDIIMIKKLALIFDVTTDELLAPIKVTI